MYIHMHVHLSLPLWLEQVPVSSQRSSASQLHAALVQREKLCQGIYAAFLNCDFGFARCACVCTFKSL